MKATPSVALLCEVMRVTWSPMTVSAPSGRKPGYQCQVLIDGRGVREQAVERDQRGYGRKQREQRVERDAGGHQQDAVVLHALVDPPKDILPPLRRNLRRLFGQTPPVPGHPVPEAFELSLQRPLGSSEQDAAYADEGSHDHHPAWQPLRRCRWASCREGPYRLGHVGARNWSSPRQRRKTLAGSTFGATFPTLAAGHLKKPGKTDTSLHCPGSKQGPLALRH